MTGEVAAIAVRGRWLKHTYPGSPPLPERKPPPDNRWQRGDIVDALYLADDEDTVWAEWYRHLAERAIPPLAQMPRDLWTWEDDVEIHALARRGWSIAAIARHTGRDRKTVRAYLRDDRPERQRPPSCLEPYRDYLIARFADDHHVLAAVLHRSWSTSASLAPTRPWCASCAGCPDLVLHGHAHAGSPEGRIARCPSTTSRRP